MEMAFSEISLVVFTAIAPAGAVGFAVMALVARFARDVDAAERTDRHLVVPLLLVLGGLIASATHLGTPANALYVITGLGRSPLSNEVASAAAFLALGGAYWILAFPYRQRTAPKTALLAASVVAAAGFVLFVSRAYAVESIVTWNNPLAPLTQWACAVAAGALVGLFGLRIARFPVSRGVGLGLVALSLAAACACVCLLVNELGVLSSMRTVTTNAADMAPFFTAQIAAFALLSALGAACAFTGEGRARAVRDGGGEGAPASSDAEAVAPVRGRHPENNLGGKRPAPLGPGESGPKRPDSSRKGMMRPAVFSGIAAALVLAACFVVRFAFYAMYMTAGI